jgi:PilZ domain
VTLVYDQSIHETEVLTERRRGLRVARQRPVKIFDAAANRYIGGRTADVSSSGLRLELPAWAPVAEGRTLSVYVGGAGSALVSHRSMIPARVVWVGPRELGTRSIVTVGIEYLASVSAHLEAA